MGSLKRKPILNFLIIMIVPIFLVSCAEETNFIDEIGTEVDLDAPPKEKPVETPAKPEPATVTDPTTPVVVSPDPVTAPTPVVEPKPVVLPEPVVVVPEPVVEPDPVVTPDPVVVPDPIVTVPDPVTPPEVKPDPIVDNPTPEPDPILPPVVDPEPVNDGISLDDEVCLNTPDSSECKTFCEQNPLHIQCMYPPSCEENPTLDKCKEYCQIFPNATKCKPLSDCLVNANQDKCKDLCEKDPSNVLCVVIDPVVTPEPVDFCTEFPDSTECLAYCIANPEAESCVVPGQPDAPTVDCSLTPTEPMCQLYCEINPLDENCVDVPEPVLVNNSESFKQKKSNNSVDIIWVIDNSGSMADEQKALSENFGRFIDSFTANKTDYKMGITTTDGGEFVNHPITSQMSESQVKNKFMKDIRVGTSGGGYEKGLESAATAVKRNKYWFSKNKNFIRKDAFLAVIVVSDENDISPKSTHSYIKKMLKAKDDAKRFAIYSIVDTKTESYPDPFYKAIKTREYKADGYINPGGLRYMNASDYTGGFYEDIHNDFSESLLSIGADIVELTKSFRLSYTPIINTIKVKVNGVENTNWFYNDDTSSVEFSVTPSEGADVQISYKYIQ